MRGHWTNLILHTSASIYKRKNNVALSYASRSIFDVFAVIFLEIFLAIISFPLYLVSKSDSAKGKSQYKIRRIFTLSFLVVILIVWLAKLVLIVGVPLYFDNRQFTVTTQDNGANQAAAQSYILPEVYNTTLDTDISVPTVEKISTEKSGGLLVSGQGNAGSKIVVNIGKTQNDAALGNNNIKIYVVNADNLGNWKLTTDVKVFNLKPGQYWLQAMAYDEIAGKKSDVSPTNYFEITQNLYDRIISRADIYLNYFMIAFIALGIFSIIILI
jgi:hypothetical protein